MIKLWKIIQKIVDLKGGVWVGLYSFTMLLALINTLFLGGNDITSGALALYGTVLGSFAVTKTAARMMNGKNGHRISEE